MNPRARTIGLLLLAASTSSACGGGPQVADAASSSPSTSTTLETVVDSTTSSTTTTIDPAEAERQKADCISRINQFLVAEDLWVAEQYARGYTEQLIEAGHLPATFDIGPVEVGFPVAAGIKLEPQEGCPGIGELVFQMDDFRNGAPQLDASGQPVGLAAAG